MSNTPIFTPTGGHFGFVRFSEGAPWFSNFFQFFLRTWDQEVSSDQFIRSSWWSETMTLYSPPLFIGGHFCHQKEKNKIKNNKKMSQSTDPSWKVYLAVKQDFFSFFVAWGLFSFRLSWPIISCIHQMQCFHHVLSPNTFWLLHAVPFCMSVPSIFKWYPDNFKF